MPKRIKVTIDPSKDNLTSTELDYLQKLIEAKEMLHIEDGYNAFKIRKTAGRKRNRGWRNRPAHKIDENTFVHLKNFSLIRFPGSDRYYVISKELAKGPRGKVKILSYYFTKNINGNLVRKKSDEEEVIKIIKNKPQANDRKMTKAKNKDEAKQEATIARNAGKINAVSAVNPDPNSVSAYIKMPKAKGMHLEHYLQSHRDISLEERLTIIKLIVAELKKIHAAGYYFIDLKPENIFYDGNQITFVDWGSAGTPINYKNVSESPLFASITRDSDAAQREAYALAGLAGVILSKFDSENRSYHSLPILKKKSNTKNIRQIITKDYDFSKLQKPFKLRAYSEEETAFKAVVDNLADMGSHDVNKRDPILNDNYSTLVEKINELEFNLKHVWIKTITEALEKAYRSQALDRSLIDDLKEYGRIDPNSGQMLDLEKVAECIGNIICEVLKQINKITGSDILQVIKKNLPQEVFYALTDDHRKQLDQNSTVKFGRLFHQKAPANTLEAQEEKSTKIRSVH